MEGERELPEAEASEIFNTRSQMLQEVTGRATCLPCNALLFQALRQFRSAEKLEHVSELIVCSLLYRISRNSFICSVRFRKIRLLYQEM